MKLLCWNIGMKINNTDKILKFLTNDNFNILVFQETLKAYDDNVIKTYRTYNDIIKNFEQKYPFHAFAPTWGAKTIITNGEIECEFGGFIEHGNFIMSNYEIKSSENLFYHRQYDCDPILDGTFFERDDHGRSIQRLLVDINGKTLQIINVHGIWNKGKTGDERTLKQCQFIIDKALEIDYPTIIAGDFNLLPESDSIKLMNKYFRNLIVENNIQTTRSYLDKRNIVCDYILVNDKIQVNDFKVINNNISDHLPLELDFDLQ